MLESHRLAAHVPPVAPIHPAYPVNGNGNGKHEELAARQERVDQLIRNYRVRGHIISDIDPLDQFRPRPPELDPAYYGFTEADFDRVFSTRTMQGPKQRTLREIVSWLQQHLLPLDRRAVHAHRRLWRPRVAARRGWKRPRTASSCRATSSCAF